MTGGRSQALAVAIPTVMFAALFAVGALAYDFPCLPGYAATGLDGGMSRGGALIAGARLALGQPALLGPLFLGYLVVFGAAFGLPLLLDPGTPVRRTMGFATIGVVLAALAIVIFTGPGRDCTEGVIAWEILGSTVMATGALVAGAYVMGRRSGAD